MLLVAALVRRLGQRDHLLLHLDAHALFGLASSIPVDHCACPLLSIGRQHTLHLPVRAVQQGCGFYPTPLSCQDAIQDHHSFLFVSVQCNCLLHRMTFSLNTYPMTISQNANISSWIPLAGTRSLCYHRPIEVLNYAGDVITVDYGNHSKRCKKYPDSPASWVSGSRAIPLHPCSIGLYWLRLRANNLWTILLCPVPTQLVLERLYSSLGPGCPGQNECSSTAG